MSSVLVLVLGLGARATAQTVVYNPTKVLFGSPDHATNVSWYVAEYWLVGVNPETGAPFSTSTLPKAAVTATATGYEAPLSALVPLPAPVVGQQYVLTLRAVGLDTTQQSPRSGISGPFARALVPATPQQVSVQ